MVNSIRDKLNEDDTVSEIRLMLGHNRETVCLVVEGEDDQKLFHSLFSNNVDIFQSYASSTGVDNIVNNYFFGNKRVVGIRDKDYLDHPINDQCFFCDYCCAEMMVISIDSCFDRLYCNFYKSNSMNSEEVRLHCLERLEKLSKLRLLNYREDWNIRFDGIKPSKHYQSNIALMNAAIISDLNTNNPNNEINSSREILCEELQPCTNVEDYLNITNGHDFINLFCKVCLNTHGQASIDSIQNTLRGTFGKDEFMSTRLYDSLLHYQIQNNVIIVDT